MKAVSLEKVMVMPQLNPTEQAQRILVETEAGQLGGRLKIRLENYDGALGWYTSGSLSLGTRQLTQLEQAIGAMRASCAHADTEGKIIPFPGLCG